MAVTETWIQDGVCDGELFGDSYVVYRKDRNLNALNVSRGGGVLIGVRHDLVSSRIDLSYLEAQLPAIDVVGCRVVIHGKSVYLFVIYIRLIHLLSTMKHFLTFFQRFHPSKTKK